MADEDSRTSNEHVDHVCKVRMELIFASYQGVICILLNFLSRQPLQEIDCIFFHSPYELNIKFYQVTVINMDD